MDDGWADRKEPLLIIMSMIYFSVDTAKSSDIYLDVFFSIFEIHNWGEEKHLLMTL